MWKLDWDDAFNNFVNIENPNSFLEECKQRSSSFKSNSAVIGQMELDIPYGDHTREKYDVFSPHETSKGTVIFLHGGFWFRTGREHWSFTAQGILSQGWTVVIPSYPQAPDVKITQITNSVSKLIYKILDDFNGSIRMIGHSAGGHLASRMVCKKILKNSEHERIEKVISVSGLYDLRPLLMTKLNDILSLNYDEAIHESCFLYDPIDTKVICWVGANERPEFLRQNRILTEAWSKKSKDIESYYDPGKDHFTVIDQLEEKESLLTQSITK